MLGTVIEFPFAVLDQEGVGKLVEMGIKLGRGTRPDLEVGICGEHGGEPSPVEFCHRVGRGPAESRLRGVPSMGRISLDERSQSELMAATVAEPQGVAARGS